MTIGNDDIPRFTSVEEAVFGRAAVLEAVLARTGDMLALIDRLEAIVGPENLEDDLSREG